MRQMSYEEALLWLLDLTDPYRSVLYTYEHRIEVWSNKEAVGTITYETFKRLQETHRPKGLDPGHLEFEHADYDGGHFVWQTTEE